MKTDAEGGRTGGAGEVKREEDIRGQWREEDWGWWGARTGNMRKWRKNKKTWMQKGKRRRRSGSRQRHSRLH